MSDSGGTVEALISGAGAEPMLHFVLKVVSRCNLNCSYCYVYNKGDDSWRARPNFMSSEVFAAAVHRIARHCEQSGQPSVRMTFHGGEPCLAGPERFDAWCRQLREGLTRVPQVDLVVQTNGTLIDDSWIEVFRRRDVTVGVSIDGPKATHDANRVDHRGRGSYDSVRRGLARLHDAGIPLELLCVIQPGHDGLAVHRHFLELEAQSINYLLPDYTHDTIGEVRERFGLTPCADYLLPILEHWWEEGRMDVRVSMFVQMARLILGGQSTMDVFGNPPLGFAFVEADGAIEALDVLRVCQPRTSATGLNVVTNDFSEIVRASPLHRRVMFEGMPLPEACEPCPEATTCAGGYLPHRWSQQRGFDNPSVWSADILALFTRLRQMLDVGVGETAARRDLFDELRSVPVGPAGINPAVTPI